MSEPAANVSAAWIARLLQTTDSFYPTGTYAHSFGLEGLVQAGAVRDRATLREFLLGQVVPQLGLTELPLAARAWDAAGSAPDWETLRALCELGAALRGTRELRAASAAIGAQRHAGAQAVRQQHLVCFGQPDLPGETGILDRAKRAGACTAAGTRNVDHVRRRLGDTGSDRAHAHL